MKQWINLIPVASRYTQHGHAITLDINFQNIAESLDDFRAIPKDLPQHTLYKFLVGSEEISESSF